MMLIMKLIYSHNRTLDEASVIKKLVCSNPFKGAAEAIDSY